MCVNHPDNAWVYSDSGRLWACNFSLQLAKALTAESDFPGALKVLESSSKSAAVMNQPQLEVSSLLVSCERMAPSSEEGFLRFEDSNRLLPCISLFAIEVCTVGRTLVFH